jgi:hypothetical protein
MDNPNCDYYSGIQYGGIRMEISEDQGQEFRHVTFHGTVTGNAQGGALRVETDYGYLDLGPKNSGYAHLSTDKNKFLLNKPIVLENSELSSYSTNNLYLQTNGTNRMTILNANKQKPFGLLK